MTNNKDLDTGTLEEPQLMEFDFSDECVEEIRAEIQKQILIEQLIETAGKNDE